VNPNLSAGDIPLSHDWTPSADMAQVAMEWAYGYRTDFKAVEISPLTFRPYYNVYKHENDETEMAAAAVATPEQSSTSARSQNKRKAAAVTSQQVSLEDEDEDEEGWETWKAAAERFYGMTADNLLSGHRAYLNYFLTHEVFPNYESYLVYCYNRYCVHASQPRLTLPYGMKHLYEHVKASSEPIIAMNLPPEEIKSRIKSSVEIPKRVKVERTDQQSSE
jgi:hypothetical protein